MVTASLQALFDRIVEADEKLADETSPSAVLVAALAVGLDDATRDDASLSQALAAIHETMSAEGFLNTVQTTMETAPADLISPLPPARRRAAERSSWTWIWTAAAMAAAAIAAMVLSARPEPPVTFGGPLMATSQPLPAPAQKQDKLAPEVGKNKPRLLPAGAAETVPAPRPRKAAPAMAPEGMDVTPAPPAR